MTPSQQASLEGLVGRSLSGVEIAAIDGHIEAGDFGVVAEMLSAGRSRLVPYYISERGVRAMAVLPRHRHALLCVLRDAVQQTPAWLIPTLTAAGIPAEDHAALADDLACAHRWLLSAEGLDVGTEAVQRMLDLIAAAVPEAAPACAAVQTMGLEPDKIHHSAIVAVFRG